ncbi:unnamed protein product, partial [Owenia fusiformis]
KKHKMFDQRSSGLMKIEKEGTSMICLCSKMYIVTDSESPNIPDKGSRKGLNKHSLVNPLQSFQTALKDQINEPSVKRGFRVKNNSVFRYNMKRRGFSYLYITCNRCAQKSLTVTKPGQAGAAVGLSLKHSTL